MSNVASVDQLPDSHVSADSCEAVSAQDCVPAWHAGFLRLWPAILQHAVVEFRSLRPEAREEAVQEVVVNAMAAYARLAQLGKENLAFATPLAHYAVAQYRSGRLTATRMNVRDVSSFRCQRRKGIVVERLDRWDEDGECWREVLVEDPNCTPADLAAYRIDFAAWLDTLPSRHRKAAKLLATGERTLDAARKLRLSPARISQLRRELHEAWEQFHGERSAVDGRQVAA